MATVWWLRDKSCLPPCLGRYHLMHRRKWQIPRFLSQDPNGHSKSKAAQVWFWLPKLGIASNETWWPWACVKCFLNIWTQIYMLNVLTSFIFILSFSPIGALFCFRLLRLYALFNSSMAVGGNLMTMEAAMLTSEICRNRSDPFRPRNLLQTWAQINVGRIGERVLSK